MTRLDFTAFDKALTSLEKSLADSHDASFMASLSASQHQLVIAGTIQNFEFTYELCWKYIKRWLSLNYGASQVDGAPRRELFRQALQNQLIEDVETWMRYHIARNQTSHTYEQETAKDIFELIPSFFSDARKLQQQLKIKNV